MALNFDDLASTTFKNYRKSFTDNIMKKIALYAYMKKKGMIERKKGGLTLVEPLMYGLNGTFGSYSGYDVLPNTPQKGMTAAEYQWKNLSEAITISKEEEDINAGESRILNLLKAKIQQAEKTYTLNFNQMLFGDGSGNSGKDVAGLQAYVKSAPNTSTTVGGIDPSTYTWWQNQVPTGSNPVATFVTNGLGLTNMRSVYNLCCREGDQPDVIITTRELFEAYESLMTTIERINFSKGSPLAGDLGFETLTFKGKTMFWDYHCQDIAGVGKPMYFLNTDYLKLIVDSDTDFDMTDWRVPVNQMAKTAYILFRGQLICNNRLTQGMIAFTSAA